MKTTSFETSKKLKELGVDLPTKLFWQPHYIDIKEPDSSKWQLRYADGLIHPYPKFHIPAPGEDHLKGAYKAYTLEDILKVLPIKFKLGWHVMPNGISHTNKKGLNCIPRKENETLADTAARLLIKLIEDKIITVEEVNK